jgi:hypothetical protein
MTSLFISYRRDDGAGHAGRLYDRLSARFGSEQVFIDHYDLAPGQDFPSAIESSLARADVVLALIGPRWIDARDARGQLRLAQADDFVRRELLAALASGKRVIPLLIGGARMPGAAELPAELAALSRLQAWELRDARFDDDLNALLAQLSAPTERSRGTQPDIAARLTGEWVAEVQYRWGVRATERFRFEVDGDELFGSGTFLSGEHPLEDPELLPDGARFLLHSEAVQGQETRRIKHRYRVRVDEDTLHVRMQSSGGFSDSPTHTFTARRCAKPSVSGK